MKTRTMRIGLTAPLSGIGILIAAIVITGVRDVQGSEVEAEVTVAGTAEPVAGDWKPPFRGSAFTYRNVATAISFSRDAEPTYNPYYAMAFTFSPRWWVGDIFNTSLALTLMRELTNSDWTTEAGETTLSDLQLRIGADRFATIPILGIDIGASLGLLAPTSKASQARTMIMGIKPGLSLSRTFDLLSGVGLSYSFAATKTFHDSTTAQREEPNVAGCIGTTGGCESYMNTGVRNASWGLANSFGMNVQFVEWLGVSASMTLLHSFLYEQGVGDGVVDDGTGLTNQSSDDVGGSGQDIRYVMAYNVEISVSPVPALGVAIGAQTVNPQQSPDSTYETPFFNRYTAVYLDLRLDFGGLATSLKN